MISLKKDKYFFFKKILMGRKYLWEECDYLFIFISLK